MISHCFYKGHKSYGYKTDNGIWEVPGAKMNTKVGSSTWLSMVARWKRFMLSPVADLAQECFLLTQGVCGRFGSHF